MIEFAGKKSNECKTFMLSLEMKRERVLLLAFSVIVIIIIAIVAYATSSFIPLFLLLCPVAFIVCAFRAPTLDRYNSANMDYRVIIVDQTIALETDTGAIIMQYVSDVSKVIDYGEWYYIKFKKPIAHKFVCQKDLIIQGTIYDFETLFQGVLVKSQ